MKFKIALFVIVVIAALLRFYDLGETPKGLYIDEPSLGYNSYTILKTGKDEHGTAFPLAFKAFGEYKLPGYIYASVPVIATFGLSPFSTRFISAFSGTAAVLGIYLLTNAVLAKSSYKSVKIPLIAALLWAFSPWNIQLSRAAFEANMMVALVIFGIFFLIKYVDRPKTHTALLSVALFVAAFYTYNAARLVLPVILLAYLALYLKSLPKFKLALPVLIIAICAIPALIGLVSTDENARIKAVFELENKQYMQGPVMGVLQKYFTHFSAEFLFYKGDLNSARHGLQDFGMFYLFEVISIGIGAFYLLKSSTKHGKLLIIWLLVAPLPAAFSTPVPHALRASLMLPPLVIMSALGLYQFSSFIHNNINNKVARLGIFVITTFCIVFAAVSYLHIYYLHYKFRHSWDWNEHVTLVSKFITEKYPNQERYIIEGDPRNIIYIKFFNAVQNRNTKDNQYLFISTDSPVALQNGDLVAISGWKGAPAELKNVTDLKMMNNSIGYKVGIYQK